MEEQEGLPEDENAAVSSSEQPGGVRTEPAEEAERKNSAAESSRPSLGQDTSHRQAVADQPEEAPVATDGSQPPDTVTPTDATAFANEFANVASEQVQASADAAKDEEEPENTDPQDEEQQTEDPAEKTKAPHNVKRTVELATDNDRGDVADWGRTGEQSPVDLSANGDDANSMSSGMSPRDREWSPEGRGGPRSRPFGPAEGLASLVHHTKTYMASQQLRKKGQAPASMGLADDLATRLAYESLSSLSGMASKVQETIEHNRRAFANQVAMIDRQTLQKALYAWKTYQAGKRDRRAKLRRAVNRILRGCLSRAFYRWRNNLAAEEKSRLQRRKVQVTLSKGLMSRCFFEWRRLADDRWWKKQLLFREREIELLEKLCGGFRNRPFVVLRKRRLRQVLRCWLSQAVRLRRKRLRLARAVRAFRSHQMLAAWNTWMEYTDKRREKRAQLNKMIRRMKYVHLGQAWRAWVRKVGASKEKRPKIYRAAVLMLRNRAGKAFRSWVGFVHGRVDKRKIVARWQRPVKGRAFQTWVEFCEWRRSMRALLRKAVPRMNSVMLSATYQAWKQATVRSRKEQLQDNVGDNTTQIEAMKAENDRLRRDNERFVRIIDSGEWGRGRVAELVQAGQVLKTERDQLAQLMGHLRQDYEAVERAKVAQQEELGALKDRMRKKGAANNKMLVKGGSSFNALMRAMKQQVIDTNTGERDPNLLFEINKMSMNKLQVFPDGELDVKAIADNSSTPAYVQASGAVRTMHGRGQPGAARPRSTGGAPPSANDRPPPPGSMRNPLGSTTAQDVARALYSLSPSEMQQLQAGINDAGTSRTQSGLNPASPRPAFS